MFLYLKRKGLNMGDYIDENLYSSGSVYQLLMFWMHHNFDKGYRYYCCLVWMSISFNGCITQGITLSVELNITEPTYFYSIVYS